ncbi:hypothetical protein [Brevundimonas sp.]|uniref:hypothetical protein n=1 Tax=Brevundimonas sp. TaxID=1871086 RepID=UPI002D66BCF9|nr:hypothetical protein [Brevundimonas sp.]HYD26984.1 hypothetical protein [Brevundimonas sp.]
MPGEVLTVESVTSLYLFGSTTVPSNLNTDAYIPDGTIRPPVEADFGQFMSVGGGPNAGVSGGEGYDQIFIEGRANNYYDYVDFEALVSTVADDLIYYAGDQEGTVYGHDGDDTVTVATPHEDNVGSYDFVGGSGSDIVVFETEVLSLQERNNGFGPWDVTVSGFESLIDGHMGQNVNWLCGVGDYNFSEEPGILERHSWSVHGSGVEYWRLSLVVTDDDDNDGITSAHITYFYQEDLTLEGDSPGYSINIYVNDFSWGDFGIG